MLEPAQVYGEYVNVDGRIISMNFEESGFIYENSFEETNPENMGFRVVLNIAQVPENQLTYLPMRNTRIIAEKESEQKHVHPFIKNSNELDIKTIVINHEQLEADNITNLYSLISKAWKNLDTNYVNNIIWDEIKGQKIKIKGVELCDKIISTSVSLNRSDIQESEANFDLVNAAKSELEKHIHPDSFGGSMYIPEDSTTYIKASDEYIKLQFNGNKWEVTKSR